MNYLISQIANFENCNAGVPLSLLRQAGADVIADEWQDNAALIAAIDAGMDYDEAAAIVPHAGRACRPSRGNAENDQRPRDWGDTNHRGGRARDPCVKTPMIHCQNTRKTYGPIIAEYVIPIRRPA